MLESPKRRRRTRCFTIAGLPASIQKRLVTNIAGELGSELLEKVGLASQLVLTKLH